MQFDSEAERRLIIINNNNNRMINETVSKSIQKDSPVLFVSTTVVMLSPSEDMQVYDRISNATPREMHFSVSYRSVLIYDKVITAT